ncbi:DHH family phosphoesterase [Rubrivirga sp. IMCC45206]|uniref:DHH family phosphoesterase n=1 Tax=Rubrivirga sp. IMCC45206 TaxID=3391614 RepID=UPI00398FB662
MPPLSPIPLADAFPEAVHTTKQWLAAVPTDARVVVFCHFDADGLAAGALFGRGLPLMGYSDVIVVPSGRSESAFTDAARERLRALAPDALVVTDLGVNEAGTLEDDGIPVLYVDHHRPSGAPDAHVISGYDWDPIPCSAWLAYDLLEAAVPDVDELRELDWIAAVGVLSDLGDKAPWPLLPDAKRRHTAKWLKETVALVNAARRAPTFDAQTALDALMEFDGPKALATDDSPAADRLRQARAVVKAEVAEARRAAPVFSDRDAAVPEGVAPPDLRFALVRVSSAAQVHPLIAQQWRGRLREYPVICANTGYLDGLVAFSTRAARDDVRLPAIYQSIDTPGWNGKWGHGHDQASGGHLPPDVFDAVLDALGFGPEAHVSGSSAEDGA